MKKYMYLIISICAIVLTGTIVYYLLVIMPSIDQKRLDLQKQEQANIDHNKKQELKQKCLSDRMNAIEQDQKSGIPSVGTYAVEQQDCSKI